MANHELAERIEAAFAMAREKLAVAKRILAAGYPTDALPLAYSAASHAVQALILVEGGDPRAHEGTGGLPASAPAAPGGIPLSRRLFREPKDEAEGEDGDDRPVVPAVTAEEARRAVASVESYIAALDALLRAKGFDTTD